MSLPSTHVSTNALDAGSDNPATARGDLLDLIQKFNATIDYLSALPQGVGVGQAYHNVTSSRVAATAYTNSTAAAITVIIGFTNGNILPTIGDYTLHPWSAANNDTHTVYSFVVPPGKTYSVTGFSAASGHTWTELS